MPPVIINKEPKLEDMICINIHPFSWNYAIKNGHRTSAYNHWIDDFKEQYYQIPTQEDLEAEGIDFTKPIRVHLKYINKPNFDTTNLDKTVIDRLFNTYDGVWLVDDNIVKSRVDETIGYCDNFEDGKIYISIENI